MIFDYITYILGGMLIGLGATIVPGPIAVICIQRTLNGSRNLGFVSGLGAATADTVYSLIALFALSYINTFLSENNFWFSICAGILIMIIGFSIYNKKMRRPTATAGTVSNPSYTSNYLSILLLTMVNPMYLAGFMIIFAGVGIGGVDMELGEKFILILGVFLGAASWWFFLTWLVDRLRKKFTFRSLMRINKIAGSLIIALGAGAIIKTFLHLTKLIPL